MDRPFEPKADGGFLNIPIPSELPSTPEFKKVPDHIMRSGVVDSLIQQNDDLMARLKVSLRRIANLEEKVSHYEKLNSKFKKHYESLKDQVEILKEKDAFVSGRHEGLEQTVREKTQKLNNLEKNYALLYSESKDQKDVYLQKIRELQTYLKRFDKYRKSIRKRKISFKAKINEKIRQAEERVSDVEKKYIEAETQLIELKKQCKSLQDDLRDKSQKSAEEKSRLIEQYESSQRELSEKNRKEISDLTERYEQEKHDLLVDQQKQVSELESAMSELELRLTRQYESKLSTRDNEILDLKKENKEAKEHSRRYDELYDENVHLQNRLVFDERRFEEQKTELHNEINTLKQSVARYRQNHREADEQSEKLKNDNQRLSRENEKYESDSKVLREQVENLQQLWKDAQRDLEKQLEKNKSLQKLNQNLSISMNQNRKELKDIKTKLERTQLGSTHFKSNNQSQNRWSIDKTIEDVKASPQDAVIEGRLPVDSKDKDVIPNKEDMSSKIDSIIAEIQTGFSKD